MIKTHKEGEEVKNKIIKRLKYLNMSKENVFYLKIK